ncbi:MAG: hypothetical protein AAFO15_00830 [Pseudomonadota bacterium]
MLLEYCLYLTSLLSTNLNDIIISTDATNAISTGTSGAGEDIITTIACLILYYLKTIGGFIFIIMIIIMIITYIMKGHFDGWAALQKFIFCMIFMYAEEIFLWMQQITGSSGETASLVCDSINNSN